jgi:hypothetical protein
MSRVKISENQLFAFTALALGIITLFLYWPVWGNDFINTDDKVYITENPHVTGGLTLANVRWALTSTDAANWHPLTWMSHMMDCQLFGLEPGAHHMVSVFFHIANSLLLLLLLKDTTGALWRSVIVAALFAWHPMHVESVSWASERKDVLSTLFWLLSLLAYVRYSRNQKVTPYILSLLFFIGGLMSKPMVVTLPFVLLLLDWWPLNRVTRKNLARLLLEKIPFFALALGGCITTYFAQATGGAISNPKWLEKIGSVAVSYVNYVSKLVYPVDLAFPYSEHGHPPVSWALASVVLLLVWSGVALAQAREKPYFVVGWFYFLGALVPTIGIIKVGSQTMADRYSYIPSIGLFIVIVWGLNDLLRSLPNRRTIFLITSVASLALCLTLCEKQISYWRSNLTLFWHTVAVTEENYLADDWMGEACREAGLKKQALYLFSESVRIESHFLGSQQDLGVQLLDAGRDAEALVHFKMAVTLAPTDPGSQQNLGVYLTTHKQTAEGLIHFEKALTLEPTSISYKNQIAWIYATCSDPKSRNGQRALQLAQQACEATWYADPPYLRTLAMAYAETGDFSSAAHWLEKARIIAVSHRQLEFMVDFDKYQKAVIAKKSYSDPTL